MSRSQLGELTLPHPFVVVHVTDFSLSLFKGLWPQSLSSYISLRQSLLLVQNLCTLLAQAFRVPTQCGEGSVIASIHRSEERILCSALYS